MHTFGASITLCNVVARAVSQPRHPRRRSLGVVPLAFVATCAAPVCLRAQDEFADVRAHAAQLVADGAVAGLAIAVARGGEIVWEESFGWADKERRVPLTPGTALMLASVSKPITATGLMVLVERGLVDLDAPIDDYLGAAHLTAKVGDARAATVRRVANHTAGLSRYGRGYPADSARFARPMGEVIARYGIIVYPPGERFEYSNLGYGLIDHVIARVGGTTFPVFMREEVFKPLGLTSMFVYPDTLPGIPITVGYDAQGNPLPPSVYDHAGATSVYGTARDLVQFGMFHLKDRLPTQRPILSDRAIDAMHVPTTEGAADPYGMAGSPYGLGWFIASERGHRVLQHTGGGGGASTRLVLYPEQDVAVAVLGNQEAGAPQVIAREILMALDLADPYPVPDAMNTSFEPPPESRGEWDGVIVTHEGDVPIALTVDSARVLVQFGSDSAVQAIRPVRAGGAMGFFVVRGLRMSDIPPQHALRFDLRLDGDCLCGSVVTRPTTTGPGVPTLPFWVELHRREGPRE